MNGKSIVALLFAVSLSSGVSAQEQIPAADSAGRSTVPAETVLVSDSVPAKRNHFFRRFYNYFKNANEDKTLTKKFDFSVIGGPHYSSDTKLGLGLVAAGLFRMDRTDMITPPSNISLFGDITTTGFYLLGVRGNLIFRDTKHRLDFTTYFFSFPSAFWGIGHYAAEHNTPSSYKRFQTQFKIDYMTRVARNLYVGVNGSFQYVAGSNFTNIEQLGGQKTFYTNTGLGAFVLYDSRDVINNAYRGIYAKIDQRFFPKFIGNNGTFYHTEVNFNAYHKLWKGAVMAYDFYGVVNKGDTPWTMLALLGGSYRMRGYYEGRYRDNDMVEIQAELRQRIYGRSGAAVWVGAGNVFPNFGSFKLNQTLPNYGIGYRWEFKKRVNVRLDYGFGKRGNNSFLFQINEAF